MSTTANWATPDFANGVGVLKFKLFRIPVQILPGFWLVSYLVASSSRASVAKELAYAVMILMSILIHELGHAIAAKRCGRSPEISIHAFGGLTEWSPTPALSRLRHIGIAAAGPTVGILLAALASTMMRLPALRTAHDVLDFIVTFNIVWSFYNLLPILPQDGGQLLAHMLGPNLRQLSLLLSLIFALLFVVGFWYLQWKIVAQIVGVSGIMEYEVERRKQRTSRSARFERAYAHSRRAMQNTDAARAWRLLHLKAAAPVTAEQRLRSTILGAWVGLALGDRDKARRKIRELPKRSIDPLLQALVLQADGETQRAIVSLQRARVAGDTRPQVAIALIRALLKDGRYEDAGEILREAKIPGGFKFAMLRSASNRDHSSH